MKRIIDISDEYYKAITGIPDHQCTADMLIIKYSIPHETVTEFADRCKECGAKYGKLLKQQSCDDAISRKELDNALYDHFHDEDSQTNMTDVSLGAIRNFVRNFPLVTPKQEIGHWSRKTKVDAYDLAGVKTWGIKCQCDRCTFTTIVVEDFGYYEYCPHCGAKMEVEEK